MPRTRRHELGVGILVLVAAGLLAWMALEVGALRGLGRFVRVSASLDDAAGLATGAQVKVNGVDVGRVDRMAIEGDHAVIDMELRVDAGLRRDARVAVRARSVLGEKYVELLPGSPDAPLLVDGDRLDVLPPPVEIDQLVNQLGPLLSSVDPAAVERTVGALDQALTSDPQRIERMVTDLETILRNGAEASAALPGLVEDTRGTLATVRATAAEARPVIARADRVVAQLESATTDLDGTRAEADALLAETRTLVQRGSALAGRLDDNGDRIEQILANIEEIDKWELRRLLREEGIVVRLRSREVVESEEPADTPE